MFCMLKKKKKHILLISQSINLNHKKQVIHLMNSNDEDGISCNKETTSIINRNKV